MPVVGQANVAPSTREKGANRSLTMAISCPRGFLRYGGPGNKPRPGALRRLQPSNQPFRWAGAWRFAYEIAFTNMDFFVDQDASIFNLPEDAPWGIWVSLTLGGRISELVNG